MWRNGNNKDIRIQWERGIDYKDNWFGWNIMKQKIKCQNTICKNNKNFKCMKEEVQINVHLTCVDFKYY